MTDRLGLIYLLGGNVVDGGKLEVFVVHELLVSRPHEGLECNTFVGLDIFDEVL